MTKTTKVLAAVVMTALVTATGSFAAEASVAMDLASAYVFRGVTFNDGLVAQPGVDVSGLPIDIGVWANFDIDDYDGAANDGQFSEIDIYASYTLPLDLEVAEFSVGYCEYTYPGSGGDSEVVTDDTGTATAEGSFGESDREVSLGMSLDLPLAPAATVYYGVDGGIESDVYVELGFGHDVELSEEVALSLAAAIGYVSPDADDAEDGFSHFTVSAGLSYACVSAGVTYVGQIDDDVLGDAYDVEVIGTVGLSKDF